MSRRVVMGLVFATGLMGVGFWWTVAEAATCLQYRTVGGSSVCSKWSTKGVKVDLTFKQDCGPDGSNCDAFVTADASAGNSIAFCQAGPSGPITRRICPVPVSFQGSTFGGNECEPKHPQDGTGTGGQGHDKGKHGCTATIVLEQSGGCDSCCASGETCLDVTPFEMETTVEAFVGGGEDLIAAQQASSNDCTVFGEGTFCFYGELCSINPKKIELNASKPYQCSVRCVGEACFGPPSED